MKTSNNPLYKEESIPLITVDPSTRKYQVNEQAIKFINSIPGPLGIVAVAGLYRTGKSYLLNRMLLNRSTGFGVGPTVNPCTKGLWIWGTPLLGQSSDGQSCNVLVIDSEGIGALDEDQAHDNTIFALTILLSSSFIYNSQGSIDENAIQNLSLVVNLTKNIQIRQLNNKELDKEDYATYFPQFSWVVRDFILQLVDQEGEPISSKEYLEKALALQKGFSDSIEQKNRIRRLLTTFFQERDCFCLVRPLTDEKQLQNLDNMEFDKLRPEFFEQVIQMRKKVLNKIKIKTIDKKQLNGGMYVGLIQNYVKAINEGAIPNIENAWTYVCRNECQKAQFEGISTYDRVMKEVTLRLPVENEELSIQHKRAKEQAFIIFRKKAVGDIVEDYFKELLEQIKLKFQTLKLQNEKESLRMCSQFIQQEYQTIERKLKNSEYKTFYDFERDTQLFQQFMIENGPKCSNKQLVIAEFLQKQIKDGSVHFINQFKDESNLQKTLKIELQKKSEEELSMLKDDFSKEKNQLWVKISTLQSQKAQFETTHQNLKDQMAELRSEKEISERKLKEEISQQKAEIQRQQNEFRSRLNQTEEIKKEQERQALVLQSEFDKEKALLEQKVVYLEKTIEEQAKKEREQGSELKLLKRDHTNQVKEIQFKLENQNKSLQQKLNEQIEKLIEMENDLKTNEQKSDMESKKWSLSQKGYLNQISELEQKVEAQVAEIRELRNQEEKYSESMLKDNQRQIRELNDKIQILEKNIKDRDDIFKCAQTDLFREKALLQQQIQFLEQQLKESQAQMSEKQRAHETYVKMLEEQQQALISKNDNKQLEELKDQHRREMKQLENEFESVKRRLVMQNEQLVEKSSEQELKLKMELSDREKQIERLKEDLCQLEQSRGKLQEKVVSLDQQKIKMLRDCEDRFQAKITVLEQQMEEAKQKQQREIRDIQNKSEESLAQLKNFYEMEKERLEKKISEDKERLDKKIAYIQEEYEQKLREEQQFFEDENEQLKQDIQDMDAQNQQIIQQYEHDLSLKSQKICALEKYVQDTKDSISNMQENNKRTLESQMQQQEQERSQLQSKIEALQKEGVEKDRALATFEQKKEYFEEQLERCGQELSSLKEEIQVERDHLNKKVEEAREKYQSLNDEFVEKKIAFSREIALLHQQNEFLAKKVEEYKTQLSESYGKYEQTLEHQQNELQSDMNTRLQRTAEELESFKSKYEKVKKNLKEQELEFGKQVSQLAKEKQDMADKLNEIATKKNEQEIKFQTEIKNLNLKIQQLQESLSSERQTMQSEIEKYIELNKKIEQDKGDLKNSYEHDKALWEGKFAFLEQQKDEAKQSALEATRQFEKTVLQIQKMKQQREEELEKSQGQEVIANLEKKHSQILASQKEEHQRQLDSWQEKYNKLEKEIKSLKEQQALDSHGRLGNQLFNEKKFVEYIENEKKLLQEIENVKQERDQKIVEYSQQMQKEKEFLKSKIAEIDSKCRELEKKKSELIFDFEKEKAKWNLEKNSLVSQFQDLKEQFEQLDRKKEQMTRENERLKNENRKNRTNINQMNGTNNLMRYKIFAGQIQQQQQARLQQLQDVSDENSNNTSLLSEKDHKLGDITNINLIANNAHHENLGNSNFHYNLLKNNISYNNYNPNNAEYDENNEIQYQNYK